MGDDWEPDDPPEEAYSRVTNPERFRPLHGFAERFLEQLEAEFDVSREEGYGIDDELEGDERPTVRLVPRSEHAGSITIAFSSFPGLRVRMGQWFVEHMPACGCDACDETAEEGIDHLQRLVRDLTAGRLSESIELGLMGDGWLTDDWGGGRGGKSRITRSRARALIASAGGRRRFDYGPWPPRTPLDTATI